MAHQNEKLPHNIRSRVLGRTELSFQKREEIFDKFFNKFSKICNDPEMFKSSFVRLDKISDKKKVKLKSNISQKNLTYKKRKELGLYTLGKTSLKYKDLLPLHKLWKEYMSKYMNLDKLRARNWRNHPEDENDEMINQKLYRADFHGSKMTVVRSKCHSLVGKSGIVAMEHKNCFKLLGSDNIVRTIPKSSCTFTFELDEFSFSFFGKNLLVRPAERSSKKIKTIVTNDL